MKPAEHADPDCPRCEGEGVVVIEVTKTGTRWEDDGHGNPVAYPIPERALEQRFCGCLTPTDDPDTGGEDE